MLILLVQASALMLLLNLSGQSHADLSYASVMSVMLVVYFSTDMKILPIVLNQEKITRFPKDGATIAFNLFSNLRYHTCVFYEILSIFYTILVLKNIVKTILSTYKDPDKCNFG